LIANLREALDVARSAIGSTDEARAAAPHTAPGGETYDSLNYQIIRLATHLSYHVGEAYYASKLLGKD
jgi:hypothetical protein